MCSFSPSPAQTVQLLSVIQPPTIGGQRFNDLKDLSAIHCQKDIDWLQDTNYKSLSTLLDLPTSHLWIYLDRQKARSQIILLHSITTAVSAGFNTLSQTQSDLYSRSVTCSLKLLKIIFFVLQTSQRISGSGQKLTTEFSLFQSSVLSLSLISVNFTSLNLK